MRNKTFKHLKAILGFFALSTLILNNSCKETDYMTFDEDYSGIYFLKDSMHYSFGITPIEKRIHTHLVPLQILGKPASADREFNVIILDATGNKEALEGVQFQLPEKMYVLADSINAYLPIEILRDGLAGDDNTGYTKYELRLQLVENNEFVPTLSPADQQVVVTFDNAVERPEWYNTDGEKTWIITRFGEWHPVKLIKFVEYFHTNLKENAPSTYNKMVETYGENLEHIPYGWPSDFSYTVIKYIMNPMYEYFLAHPELGITDFPKP